MRNDLKKKLTAFLTAVMMIVMAGCSAQAQQDEGANGITVYYINNDETKTESYPYTLKSSDARGVVEELLEKLSEKSANAQYKAPLAMGFELRDYTFDDGKVVLNMSADYKKLVFTTEVLVRAAIVKTLCGSGYVKEVYFTVEGEPLMDHSGFEVGRMDAGTFISNDGNEINTYEEADVMLYFASVDGNTLIGVYRNKFYSTSMPLERFVVDELIIGPSGQVEGLYRSVNPQTSVLSVNSKDGVCYVNLSADFLIPYENVPTSISVYSIVNSLCELPNIDKVQILVDGVVPEILESSYEKNTEMVITLEEAQALVHATPETD
ncbi:MAG: GerMN domain-containing protein [Lachnospiraceae bacterium]|nr:GerMN domain-containing protein [Lachnospiraceae bacterium]